MKRWLFFYFFIIFLLLSCIDERPERNKLNKQDILVGKIVEKQKCNFDSQIQYSYYAPTTYNPEYRYPIIFIFDARARATLLIKRFKNAAEKFGYILIGSLNSRNGQSSEQGLMIYDQLLKEAVSKFSIDKRRIYTAGFSGGARVASSVAIFRGGIHSVIAFSAGFPKIDKPIKNKFHFIGFVGNKDFNYHEMISLKTALDKAQLKNHLVIFDGTHDLPPEDAIETALLWNECMAVKDKLIPLKKLLHKAFEKDKKILNFALKQNDVYLSYAVSEKIINFYDGIFPIDSIVNIKEKIKNSKEFINFQKQQEHYENVTKKYAEELSNSFNKKLEWWKMRLDEIRKQQQKTKDRRLSYSFDRLYAYLGLLAFTGANEYMNKKQWEIAKHFLEIYKMVEPTNPEYAFQYARFYLLNNDTSAALKYIKVADKLNFKDYDKVIEDTLFKKLSNNVIFESFKNNAYNRLNVQ